MKVIMDVQRYAISLKYANNKELNSSPSWGRGIQMEIEVFMILRLC